MLIMINENFVIWYTLSKVMIMLLKGEAQMKR